MTPTERQVEAIRSLDDRTLLKIAAQAMHALNRRAKKLRDDASNLRGSYGGYGSRWAKHKNDDKESIYYLKDRFLAVVVERRHQDGLYYFVRRTPSRDRFCLECDRSWVGGDICFRCGEEGDRYDEDVTTWSIVQIGRYRFHTPNALSAAACEIPEHDPTQPQREVPDIGMTISSQRFAVERYVGDL